jgi:surfactin synthase thioesterase subunit
MNAYAKRLASDIDTTLPYSIIGVSLGGMLASEMKTFLKNAFIRSLARE